MLQRTLCLCATRRCTHTIADCPRDCDVPCAFATASIDELEREARACMYHTHTQQLALDRSHTFPTNQPTNQHCAPPLRLTTSFAKWALITVDIHALEMSTFEVSVAVNAAAQALPSRWSAILMCCSWTSQPVVLTARWLLIFQTHWQTWHTTTTTVCATCTTTTIIIIAG
jgi:hypothetical protein